MIYDTKGEFIQALKDYENYYNTALKWRERYSDYYYLRYEKISSPLDYDIIGYENEEAIRLIKTHTTFNKDSVLIKQEQLDEEMQICLDEFTKMKKKMDNVNSELKNISEPLRTILELRYKQHKKLREVCKKSKLYLDEAGMYKYIMRNLDKYYVNE